MLNSFFKHLRVRRVFGTVAIYAIGAWLVLQVAETVFPGLGVPDWAIRFVIIAALAGLPLAIVFAWAYQITPQGIVRSASSGNGDVALRNADYAIIGALLIVLALIGYYAVSRLADVANQTTSSALIPGQHECDAGICAIAVLPFANLSGNPDQEYFADGITEAMISRLARIESLRLISHTTVMQYKKAPKPLPEIARELGIDAVLAGAVLRENGRVRISVQLIQVPIEHHLWTYETERPLQDTMAVQAELAQGIAQEIRIRTTEKQQQRLTASRPINPEAFDAYLRGRDLWRRRDLPAKAIEWLERSVSLDPDFAPAWAALADAYITAWNWAVIPMEEGLPKAKAAAERALTLDPALAEAHTSLASILWDTWQLAAAEDHFEQAIRLNPSYSLARQWYAEFLSNTVGRPDEALAQAEAAQRLDPLLVSTNATLASVEIYAGRYEQARERLRELLKANPEYAWSYSLLAELEVRVGRYAEALDLLERSRVTEEPRDIIEARRARVYAAWGKIDKALPILERLAAHVDRPPEATYEMARAYARLGRPQDALRYLDAAYAARNLYLLRLNTETDFDAMRVDREFCDLVTRIGIPSACSPRSSFRD
jgi:TolB-like protein/thioredoxin-like negative regulator of GroEL